MFLVADQPLLKTATIVKLVETCRAAPEAIVMPQVNGAARNPVFFPRFCLPQLKSLQGDIGGRVVVKEHPERLLPVPLPIPKNLSILIPRRFTRGWPAIGFEPLIKRNVPLPMLLQETSSGLNGFVNLAANLWNSSQDCCTPQLNWLPLQLPSLSKNQFAWNYGTSPNAASLSNYYSKLGTVPRVIGGCPKSLRAMRLSRLAPQRPGTAPVRGQSRFCCQLLLNERHSGQTPYSGSQIRLLPCQ